MKLAPILISALVLAVTGSAAAQQQPRPPAPRLERIEMETLSWGRPVSSWSIDAKGNGRQTMPEPGAFDAKRLVTHSFAAGTAGFRKVRVLLGLAEYRAGHQLACNQRVTDGAYGSVRWVQPNGRASTLRFDTGCLDRTAREVMEQLGKAEAQITTWASAGPVVRTEPIGKP